LDYETVLDSDIPEEIMLAILCDFKQEEAKEVLAKIIQRLQLWSKDAITLHKYIRQILVLSRLRKLELVTTQQLKDMALVYDIEQDALFKEGEEKGIKIGEEKGIKIGEEKGIKIGEEKGKHQKTIQGVQKALQRGRLSIEEIAEDFEVSIEFVLQVQRGEIK
jgi:predicted transposase YdaD